MTAPAPTPEMHRIVLVPTDADQNTQLSERLILDLAMDIETRISTGPFPAFGRKGDFHQPATLLPFTLMADGRLDYGAFAPAAEQPQMLNIRQVRLLPEDTVICTHAGAETRYKVVSMAPTAA